MKIDPSLFSVERLLSTMLDHGHGNHDAWRHEAEILPNYMPPYPDSTTRPRVVVKWRESFLRYSAGPRQGYFWDIYGEDMQTPELALLALLQAPVPPAALDKSVFQALNNDSESA